jgi:chaperonin GroEL
MLEPTDLAETTYELVDGLQYEQGLKNVHFVTNEENTSAELNKPFVLIVESQIESVRKIQTVLEHVIKTKRSLLIIADVDPQVLSALAMNKIKGNIKVNIIDTPTFGISRKEILNDIAFLTGATVINEDLGDDIDLIGPEHLGECLKSVTTQRDTVIQMVEPTEEVNNIIKKLEQQLIEAKNPVLVVKAEKRLARLSGKVAIVKVGANSEIELQEKQARVEDAICATKAAIKQGIVPGGGIALLNASTLYPMSSSEMILYAAIKAPFKTILMNAGIEDYKIPEELGEGLNVVTGDMVDMIKSGIIDPLLVTKSALENAASVAKTILSTDCVINNLRQ